MEDRFLNPASHSILRQNRLSNRPPTGFLWYLNGWFVTCKPFPADSISGFPSVHPHLQTSPCHIRNNANTSPCDSFQHPPGIAHSNIFFSNLRVDGVACQTVAFAPITENCIVMMMIFTARGYIAEILQIVHIHFDFPSLHVADLRFCTIALIIFIHASSLSSIITIQITVGRIHR